MNALLQILKVNDARSGTKDGRAWHMQDAECVLLTDDGQLDKVGVLMIPKELIDKVKPGKYTGGFSLRPNLSTRRIEAVLVALVPVPPAKAA
jgi:hypothetical protein